MDVKVVKRRRKKWFQYTAIDDRTRIRILRLYRRQNQHSSLAFLRELRDEMPFPIRKMQVDDGTEFPLAFALTCQELGVRVRYIKPRRPEQNGKVERSHRIDEEEFWAPLWVTTSRRRSTPWRSGRIATTMNASRWP